MQIIIKNKILKQVFTIWVIVLLVFNPFISTIIFAEEIIPLEDSVSSSSPGPSPIPTSSITTGDAQSQTDVSTEANTNVTDTLGTVTPGSDCSAPDITIDCPGTDSISSQNLSDTETANTSSAQTGQNSSSDSGGNVSIDTGEATSSAQTSNQINTNIVNVVDQATESAKVEEATPSGEFNINNQNNSRLQNEMNVDAGTGENLANQNLGKAEINSGDAMAVGNMFNLVNTNITGSNIEILVLNLTDKQGDINLFQYWMNLLNDPSDEHLIFAGNLPQNSLNVLIENNNEAELNNFLQVRAVSGKNEASGNDSVNLQSGEANAIANVTNVVNTNMVGSKLLFAIVNVLGPYQGDLILPRREYFEATQSSKQQGSGIAYNKSIAEVEDNVKALADSGDNQINNHSGDSNLKTGNATAVSRSLSFLNINFFKNNWFNFFINNLGSKQGSVLGWSSPEARDFQNDLSFYSTGSSDNLNQESADSGQTQIQNFNQAKINNQVSAEAISGQNKADNNGETNMVTGNAKALANVLNFANLNILGSNLFFGAFNILDDWQGNIVFAYPDVTASVSGPSDGVKPGDEINYTVNFTNQGFDNAHNVTVSFELPKGTNFISDTSGISPSVSGKNLKWHIGDLTIGQNSSFDIRVRIDPNLKPDDLLSFWDKLIPVAYAAEEGRQEQIKGQVTISTLDPESDSRNDFAVVTTTILFPNPIVYSDNQEQKEETTKATTSIEISARNNVNDFVYQGDTITFELQVKNTGNETAKNVLVIQDIYDGEPESTGSVEFFLGDIAPSKTAKITFGIQVRELKPDFYHTEAIAHGDNISSNKAITYFNVKEKFSLDFIPEVKAQDNNQTQKGEETGDVKGIQSCEVLVPAKKEWWPYALMAMFATLWFLEISKRKQWDIAVLKALGKK